MAADDLLGLASTTARDPLHPTEAEQGEICYRGRHIMMGYLANPKLGADHVAEIDKKTADAIDADGWLHSEDKGCIDSDGFIRITGRYKELIIGAGGENVAPVPLENFLKTHVDPATGRSYGAKNTFLFVSHFDTKDDHLTKTGSGQL